MKRVFSVALFVVLAGVAIAQTWQLSPNVLPAAVRGNAVVAYNGYIYSLGGRPADEGTSAIHAVNGVYMAKINADGSIGTWSSTTVLPAARSMGGVYAYNGRMYYWGGWGTDYTTYPTCYYATINPTDGTIGAWTTSAVAIPAGTNAQMDSFSNGIIGFNNFIYVLGGEDNSGTVMSTTYYGAIQAGGDFGAWQTGTVLPLPDWFHGTAIVQGSGAVYIYLVGGNHGGTSETQILRNTINTTTGALGATWDLLGAALPLGVYENGVAVVGNDIYSVGGLNGSTPQNTVTLVAINPATGDATVTPMNPLPVTRARVAAAGYTAGGKSFVAVVGGGTGYTASEGVNNDIYYAQVTPSSVEDWLLYQ